MIPPCAPVDDVHVEKVRAEKIVLIPKDDVVLFWISTREF
jgi:hypothetical protein